MAQDSGSGEEAAKNDELPTFKPRAIEETVPGRVIVKFKEDVGPSTKAEARRAAGLEKKEDLDLIDAEVDKVKGQSAEEAIRDLESRPEVEYAELDYIVHPTGYADEPLFGQLWGLDNTGQTVEGSPGTADVDVNGKEASSVTQGDPNLVVAVIDDGVDFSHPDLADRAWENPGESGSGKETNGVDDDVNGYIDDVNGWDFYHEDNTVHDPGEDSHGTHVSGTIAASVNNQGIVGVAPNVQIMALKFINDGSGSTVDAIHAITYAKSKGAKISNNSWGCAVPGSCFSQALKEAIEASEQLFVAAAGNSFNDNDLVPEYPASYDSPNILSVAAIDNKGNLAIFSNYGATSVDISAPGVDILSSIPDQPAAAFSSVGSSDGKAVTAGFGADEIGDSAKQASFFTKAFTAVGRGSRSVVLVDDDQSQAGRVDVGPTLSAAIQSATGSVPQVIDVGSGDGPASSQLTGKTVVWATGQACDSDGGLICSTGGSNTTLTTNDQTTLTNFLNGGGKLILTGMDALYQIENSSFVKKTLKLSVQSDVPDKTAFSGSSGTAFEGESYDLNSSTAISDFHDVLTPAVYSAATTQGVYPDTPPWRFFNGTSMAAPHATGVAALVASKSPSLLSDPTRLKQAVMDGGKPVSATAGKTVTGDMVDAMAAPPDTTPPTLDTTPPTLDTDNDVSPRNGATKQERATNISATFSEPMDLGSLSAPGVFTLKNTKTGETVPAKSITLSSDGKTVKLDPSPAKLAKRTAYNVRITTGAKDMAGNAMEAVSVWSYTTGRR